jgi:hypothetical protein
MDLTKTIEKLRREKAKLERVISSLEELRSTVAKALRQQKRRGKKSMSLEERREVSERMKKYWTDWHNKSRYRS